MTQLPAGGRKGRPPAWPLPSATVREKDLWEQLWSTPQAAAWERLGWHHQVARYVRTLVRAESRDAPVTMLGEARQFEDRLGLNPVAMLKLRWEVAEDELAERRPAPSSRPAIVDRRSAADG